MIIITTKVLSPQNQTVNIIHLRESKDFFLRSKMGISGISTDKPRMILILILCSWGAIEATLIRKISSPPIKTMI